MTLAAKGVDAAEIDKKIELKTRASTRLTRQQQDEADAVAAELAHAERELREANENEMPENELRAKAEEKRAELDGLLASFAKINMERAEASKAAGSTAGAAKPVTAQRPNFERPSERRRRLEAAAGHGGNPNSNPTFTAFGGDRRSAPSAPPRQNPASINGSKLYVGNLGYDVNRDKLRAFFEQWGTVIDCFLPMDRDSGQLRGFAFITYSTTPEAQMAATHALQFDGRMLKINEADRDSRKR